MSRKVTGTFPTMEDTATIRNYYENYLGTGPGASICVHGLFRQIGPLALLEIKDICT